MSRQGQNVGRKIIAADILSQTGQHASSNLTGFRNLLGLKCLLINFCI
jgi:hypothetical protein